MLNLKLTYVALLGAFTLVGTACAADDDSVASLAIADATPTPTEAPAPDLVEGEAEMIAFTECMREQGVKMTDPVVDSDGNVDKPAFPANFNAKKGAGELDACVGLLEGLTAAFKGTDNTDATEELLALASCLRDQGFDVDDPVLTLNGPGKKFLKDLDFEDPSVAAAFDACGFGSGQAGK
jgi:hypothetical protein